MLLQPSWNGATSAGVPAHHSSASNHTNLEEVQLRLKPGWSVHLAQDNRLYYCNHLTQTSSWIPPVESWDCTAASGFPYGWEQATDAHGKPYYINHVNRTTTYEDPRRDWTEEPAVPRVVTLERDPELGFGFVAGSEKPVIVRFVTEGGPSVGKLQPGDQILIINGEDVKKAPRDHVIKLVRACKETVSLTVCQPPLDNSTRKSTLLSAAKKAKLKSNPSRVRFAEGVVVNGSPLFPPSTFSLGDSSIPFLPNVLKVFLENGQTKSFKYDATTTVGDVVESLQQKLCIKAIEHFSLVVEHVKSLRRNKLTLLGPNEPLAKIAARPGSHNLRCLFRAAFVPRNACDLAQRDLTALEYLYMQCCNDVVQERYAPELKYDIALRLAALHIHQHAIQNNMTGKITVKTVEREFGLERFVPVSLMTSMKRKELRKLISHFLKLNHNLSPTGQKSLTSLQAKLYYLNIIGELPSYGAKCFSTNLRDSNMERVILVSPKFGISQIVGMRNSVPVPLADIEQMSMVTMTREDELSRRVCIQLSPNTEKMQLTFSLEDRDAEELLLVLQGYYRLLTGESLRVEQDRDVSWEDDAAPSYHCQHHVLPSKWSYCNSDDNKHYANFSITPSYQLMPVANGHLTPPAYRGTNHLDKNMNNTHNGLLNMKGLNGHPPESNGTFDVQSVVSMEILESDRPYVETRNQEVLRRVAEMQELVQTSEQYLEQQRDSEREREESDSESSHISSQDSDTPAPGELKHSDSLLLLTQGQKLLTEAVNEAVRNIDIGDNEPSESDTDSMSTPTNSPSHKANTGNSGYSSSNSLKSSDSSFGLHSPDNLLPVGFRPSDVNIQDLLKRLQEDNCLPYNFAEGTLYLDPDIIDLTMIPPPITPDELILNSELYPDLSMPPTPFADSAPLPQDSNHINRRNRVVYQQPGGQLEHMGSDVNLELEAFLASCMVQPPTQVTAPTQELTPEEILSYIIPPPPVLTPAEPPPGNSELRPQFVVEYPTVERKSGPFSCCGQTNGPPRPLEHGLARDPSPADRRAIGREEVPSLPPRAATWQPPKKPPLPPVPSQEVLRKSSMRAGVYETLRNKGSPPKMNGHVNTLQDTRQVIFNKSDQLLAGLIDRLDTTVAQCLRAQAAGGGQHMDEASFQADKEQLTTVARSLVTASKMLVKSATDGDNLAQNVSNCLRQVSQLTDLAADVAAHTTAPVQTRNLVMKVRDVVSVFRSTLRSSLIAPNDMLLQHAENLASVLATLLRSLRVFSP